MGNHQPLTYPTMAERELQDIQRKLKSSRSYNEQLPLLSSAKLALLKLKSLTPLPNTPSSTLSLARDIFETGALLSIRAKDPAAFTRYVHQLTPFYELPDERLAPSAEKNKITGLYLLLLLTQGDYAGFHTELEGLELRGGLPGGNNVENDRFLGYRLSWKGGCRREALIWFGRLWRVERFPVRSTVSSARSSRRTSALRSPHAAKQLTHPSLSPRPRTSSSSTAKAPSSSSHRHEAG